MYLFCRCTARICSSTRSDMLDCCGLILTRMTRWIQRWQHFVMFCRADKLLPNQMTLQAFILRTRIMTCAWKPRTYEAYSLAPSSSEKLLSKYEACFFPDSATLYKELYLLRNWLRLFLTDSRVFKIVELPAILQGIETVRRDNCLLVRNIVTTVLEMILIERDEKKAQDFVRQTIADLLMNRLDLSLLVITKVRSYP